MRINCVSLPQPVLFIAKVIPVRSEDQGVAAQICTRHVLENAADTTRRNRDVRRIIYHRTTRKRQERKAKTRREAADFQTPNLCAFFLVERNASGGRVGVALARFARLSR
jgi:hypothetical protein